MTQPSLKIVLDNTVNTMPKPKNDNAKKIPPTIDYGNLEFDDKQSVFVDTDVFNSQPANFDVSWATSTIKYTPTFVRSMQTSNSNGT